MSVFNTLEDQILFLVFSKIPSHMIYNSPYIDILYYFFYPINSNQPLFLFVVALLRFLFGLNYFNILLAITLCLNIFFTLYLFKSSTHKFLLTAMFVFSTYSWLHFSTHIELSQIWLYSLFVALLLKRFKYLFVLIALSPLFANYIGFFILICFLTYSLVDVFLNVIYNKKFEFSYLKFWVFSGLLSICILGIAFGNFVQHSGSNSSTSYIMSRPYEDFFTFSTRPWYFLIPSPKHPVYGEFASNALEKIESTGYFLADDYFIGEHGASFFGYSLLLTFLVVSGYIAFKGNKEQKKELLRYWLISIGLFLLMLPPYFTIAGFKIYTPGWLMYNFFPMFRTTVRMSVLILLNILIVLASFFDDLVKKYPKKQMLIFSFVALLTGVTLFETFIPIKIQKLDTPPTVYSYIGEMYEGTNFVVYPYSRTQEALFWIDAHKSYLLNPRMYIKNDFNSEIFTKALNTQEGIEKLSDISANYLLVFKDIPSEELSFFLSSDMLTLDKEFENSYVFKVVNK